MRYEPDEHSSHEYEVKNVYMEGSSFKAVVFHLLAGQEVNISLPDILKKTNLWLEPTEIGTRAGVPRVLRSSTEAC